MPHAWFVFLQLCIINHSLPFACPDPDHAHVFESFVKYWGPDPAISPIHKGNRPPAVVPLVSEEKTLNGAAVRQALVQQLRHLSNSLGPELKYNEEVVMAREWQAVLRADDAFRDEVFFLDRYLPKDPDSTSIIYLSARGFKLATHRDTIRSIEGSMLASIFNRELWHEQAENLDKDGNYYMEGASPYSLGKIMDLLRLRKRHGIDHPAIDIKESRAVEFKALVHYLFPGVEDRVYPLATFSSIIITDHNHMKALLGWLPEKKLELLYRGSRDGWNSADFHRLCDDQGPTVVLIRSSFHHIFGGYSDQAWASWDTRWVISQHAFLFSLTDGKGREPARLDLKNGAYPSIYLGKTCGPVFGDGNKGFDLFITSRPNKSPTSYSKLGSAFALPPGCDARTYLAGSRYFFMVSEMEVFKVVDCRSQ